MHHKSIQFQKDQEKLCYDYSVTNSLVAFRDKNYKDAAIHLENAIRSLNELKRMDNAQKTREYAEVLLNQARAGKLDAELLERLYE